MVQALCFYSLSVSQIHDAVEFLKTPLNVFVAEELALDGPEDLAHVTTAQIGLYTHLCQDGLTSNNRPPP
jgi:hypothetical protein